ncbi:MAG: hypothetical protein AAFU49_15630 [Pseudomonadota bacterium]
MTDAGALATENASCRRPPAVPPVDTPNWKLLSVTKGFPAHERLTINAASRACSLLAVTLGPALFSQ